MSEKVKVSYEIAEAMDKAIDTFGRNVVLQLAVLNQFRGTIKVLNKIDTLSIAEMVIKGYETENPCEAIKRIWDENNPNECHFKSREFCYRKGVRETTENILNIYNFKIKGINE